MFEAIDKLVAALSKVVNDFFAAIADIFRKKEDE